MTLQTFWSLRGKVKFVTLAGNIILISFFCPYLNTGTIPTAVCWFPVFYREKRKERVLPDDKFTNYCTQTDELKEMTLTVAFRIFKVKAKTVAMLDLIMQDNKTWFR